MTEPTIALAFTPDPWVEELHRHCTDHGGARVRQVLIDPALALEEHYDILVVSHRWPALTHGLVDDLHARGCKVLGVYERGEQVGHDWLVAVGADATVASDSGPSGIVATLRALHDDNSSTGTRGRVEDRPLPGNRAAITVVSGPAGAGATEISIALAVALRHAVVVDADDVAPALAPRLGLGLEPNLRDALDAMEYGGEDLDDHLVALHGTVTRALAGLPSVSVWPQVRPTEVLRLLARLASKPSRVIVNVSGTLEDLPVSMVRPRYAVGRAALVDADSIVAVGGVTPVAVARLLGWIGDARLLAPRAPIHVVVNRAPKSAFRRGEIVDEIARSFGVASVTIVPYDRRVEAAAWDGVLVPRGPFTRAVAKLVDAVSAGGASDNAVQIDELELRAAS